MRRSFLCVVVLLFLATVAAADQVTLKNGDRLTGTIISADGKTLVLKSEFAGDVNVSWDAVTDIESTQNLNLTLKDGKKVSGKVTTQDGKFVVASAAPVAKDTITAVRNDADQAAFEVETEKMAQSHVLHCVCLCERQLHASLAYHGQRLALRRARRLEPFAQGVRFRFCGF
jgi:small nuclear ribonucleoprotein (snRNP)-like protein